MYFRPIKKQGWLFLLSFCLISAVFGQQPKLILPFGHKENIRRIDFSADGKRLFTYAPYGNETKIWDTYSGKLLIDVDVPSTLSLPDYYSMSYDRTKIVNRLSSTAAGVWSAATGQLLGSFRLNDTSKNIWNAVFLPDSKRLLLSSNGRVEIYDIRNQQLLVSLGDLQSGEKFQQLSMDGNYIITAHDFKDIKIWNANTGKFIAGIKDSGQNEGLQFTKSGRKFLVTSVLADPLRLCVSMWDASTGQIIRRFDTQSSCYLAILSPDGEKMATLSDGKNEGAPISLKIWDVSTGAFLCSLRDTGYYDFSSSLHSPNARYKRELMDIPVKLVFSPDGRRLLEYCQNNVCKLWDLRNGRLLSTFVQEAQKDETGSIFSRDGSKLILQSEKDSIIVEEILDAESGTKVATLEISLLEELGRFTFARFSPDNKSIVVVSGRSAFLWDISSKTRVASYETHTHEIESLQFAPDGKGVLIANNNKLELWDLSEGKPAIEYNGHTMSVQTARYDRNGNRVISASYDSTSRIWDAATGKELFVLKGQMDRVNTAEFSLDGRYALTAGNDGLARIWNTSTGLQIAYCGFSGTNEIGQTSVIHEAHFSPDNSQILTRSASGPVNLWAFRGNGGNLIADLDYPDDGSISVGNQSTEAVFSHSGKKIFAARNDGKAGVFDAVSGNIIHSFDIPGGGMVHKAVFNRSASRLALAADLGSSMLVNLDSGYNVHILPVSSTLNYIEFSPDETLVAGASDNGTCGIWSASSGKLIHQLKGHTAGVTELHFSPDQSKIVSASLDNTIRLWDAINSKLLLTFFDVDSSDYISILPSGFYRASPDAARKLYYTTSDMRTIGFKQLDLKYNRPDKVLEALGCNDTARITSFKREYYMRLKKMQIDTSFFNADYDIPSADFANRDTIEPHDSLLSLHIVAKEDSNFISSFNVWINEVPLLGKTGFLLKNRRKKTFDTTITVILGEGQNYIETSVLNASGFESYRSPLIVHYLPAKKINKKLLFIGLGIDRFADSLWNIRWCVEDVFALADAFKHKYPSNIDTVTLLNRDFTLINVKALKQKLLNTNINDEVVIVYSGHGLADTTNNLILPTFNTDFKNPTINSVPWDEIEHLLDDIPARKRLILIDACQSGKFDAWDSHHHEPPIKPNTKGERLGIPVKKSVADIKAGMDLMQQLFADIGENTGATIIAASSATQDAHFDDSLKHGVFSYCVLQFLEHSSSGSVNRLARYVNNRVKTMTSGFQVPTERSHNDETDWDLWESQK